MSSIKSIYKKVLIIGVVVGLLLPHHAYAEEDHCANVESYNFRSPMLSYGDFIYMTDAIVSVDAEQVFCNVGVTDWFLTLSSPLVEYVASEHKTDSQYDPPSEIEIFPGDLDIVDGHKRWSYLPAGQYELRFGLTYSALKPHPYLNRYVESEIATVVTSEQITLYPSLEDAEAAKNPVEEFEEEVDEGSDNDDIEDGEVDEGEVGGDTDELSPEQIAEKERISKLDPVLLIHGLASYPSMWREDFNNSNYVGLLRGWGYPKEYISTYTYYGEGVGIGGYNNQGSVVEVSKNMRAAVLSLRDVSLANGGDGEVDIVAHSMGGLVARQYINEYSGDNFIDKLIAIGTPYQGSYLLSEYVARSAVQLDIQNYLMDEQIKIYTNGINPSNLALKQMTPGNTYLKQFGQMQVSNVEFNSYYGSVKSQMMLSLFNLRLKSDVSSLGDLVVSEESARWDNSPMPVSSVEFEEKSFFSVEKFIIPIGSGYRYTYLFPSMQILMYNHFNIYKQPEVKASVLKKLYE